MLRQGYARRGAWNIYYNKHGRLQTTHTDRKWFRNKRRGYSDGLPASRLRVIGYDLLISKNVSDMMSKSGTFRNRLEGTPYYTPEMLITRVSENLTLPPMKRVSVTRDGRIMLVRIIYRTLP